MFKFKTVKLVAFSLLSASTIQVIAADDAPIAGDSLNRGETAPVSKVQTRNWVDFSDPIAIYSKVGLATGTEGVDVFAAFGGYLGGQFEQKLTLEAKHDTDYYNINYLAFNTSNETGFFLNTRWDTYDEASAGVVKKLRFAADPRLNIYPSMKFGFMWDLDDSIPSTTFVELDAAIRYTANRHFWFGITPNYRYALDGLDIKDFDATVEAGYQLAEEVAVSAHVNNDEEAWVDFTFAF